ncbi:MAG: AhpC/TSA family protein [Rhodospirillales bacterium]|nr:AhpC/TSA family protein [Rhodospirillales bacterium]
MNSTIDPRPAGRPFSPKQNLPNGATLQDATTWLRSCGVIAEAVQVGEMVPEFHLNNATGDHIDLGPLLDRGPVVITFILGAGSSTCRASLRALQARLPEITKHRATLVAITPDPPPASRALVEELHLGFDLLVDGRNQLAQLFGLAYETPEPRVIWLQLLGLDDPHWPLPAVLVLPATYIVDTDGIASYAFLEPDPTRRVEPDVLLAALPSFAFQDNRRIG